MDYLLIREKRVVFVATRAELTNQHYYRRLWIATKNINIARRDWLDELANAFRDMDDNVCVLYQSGLPYEFPEIDDVFDDPDMRWMSNFLESKPVKLVPARISRQIEKLRMLDLYFRVKHPLIAAHFWR